MWLRTGIDHFVLSLALPSFLLSKQALRTVARHNTDYHYQTIHLHSRTNPASPAFILNSRFVPDLNEVTLHLEYSFHRHRSSIKQILEKPVYLMKYQVQVIQDNLLQFVKGQFSDQNLRVQLLERRGSMLQCSTVPLYMHPACSPVCTGTWHLLCTFTCPYQLRASHLFQLTIAGFPKALQAHTFTS